MNVKGRTIRHQALNKIPQVKIVTQTKCLVIVSRVSLRVWRIVMKNLLKGVDFCLLFDSNKNYPLCLNNWSVGARGVHGVFKMLCVVLSVAKRQIVG